MTYPSWYTDRTPPFGWRLYVRNITKVYSALNVQKRLWYWLLPCTYNNKSFIKAWLVITSEVTNDLLVLVYRLNMPASKHFEMLFELTCMALVLQRCCCNFCNIYIINVYGKVQKYWFFPHILLHWSQYLSHDANDVRTVSSRLSHGTTWPAYIFRLLVQYY